ncbi:MAG: hypothetical protein HUK22_01245 [Thermoguttaceae bacterium]|nr:hypothetical protein [Thermoguttaceae bacterium]
MEVRFVDGQAIYAGVLGAIRDKFLRSDLTSRPNQAELLAAASRSVPDFEAQAEADEDDDDYDDPLDRDVAQKRRLELRGWLDQSAKKTDAKPNAKSPAPAKSAAKTAEPERKSAAPKIDLEEANSALDAAARETAGVPDFFAESAAFERRAAGRPAAEFRKYPPLPESPFKPGSFGGAYDFSPKSDPADPAPSENAETARPAAVAPNAIQICNRYLAMETPDGLALIDQHALHERLLFEKLRENLAKGALDSQRLLVPVVVDLAPTELPFALENRELFVNLGLEIDAFGGNSVIVNSYPAILHKSKPDAIFLAALGALQNNFGRLEREDLLDAGLKQMACKAAVKAGDPLRDDAVAELLAAAEKEIRAKHCPHGRPSTILFTCQELDKLFRRT